MKRLSFASTVVVAAAFLMGCGDTAKPPNVQAESGDKPQVADDHKGPSPEASPQSAVADKASPDKSPEALRPLFSLLDDLGRGQVKNAKFVQLSFVNLDEPTRPRTQDAWLLEDKDDSITVLQDDLLPWTYSKTKPTTIPSSWQPVSVKLDSVKDADFEAKCKELTEVKKKDEQSSHSPLRRTGPSYRALIAHAAWKKGLSQYSKGIIDADPLDAERGASPTKYQEQVLDDLAWLHFLRGVNLLMFADRQDVLPHLRLVSKLSPKGQNTEQTNDLIERLEKLIAKKGDSMKAEDENKLDAQQRADFYISQLIDLRCPQMSQPGDIVIVLAVADGKPVENPPTLKLQQMGMTAVPALIKALDDDTPTRTVYHWRDFAQNRLVWRVSDFAWNLLREITKKDLGYRPEVGFTLSSMPPDEKHRTIEETKKWFAASKNLSEDDRMFAFFQGKNEKDWITAGQYFLKKKDNRAVAPLIEKIKQARSFDQGRLCELVAGFGDQSARPALQEVMKAAPEHADRLQAAIALWMLGDRSGIPVTIAYVEAKDQPYGSWDSPVWFLMRSRTPEGMDALKSLVTQAPAGRAGEIIGFMSASITGEMYGDRREPAGCVEACPVLIAAMDRGDFSGGTINGIKVRIKDAAATAMVLLREGNKDSFGGRFVEVDAKFFNQLEPDEHKRDVQIKDLQDWYAKNKDRLAWDSKANKLAIKPE